MNGLLAFDRAGRECWRAEHCTFATTLSALVGWSPKKGIPTMGFPWYMACIADGS